jgi:hypothetical protein
MRHLDWATLANISFVVTPIVAAIAAVGRLFWNHVTKSIVHELRPNSGTSLRDAIDRIEDKVTQTQHELELHIAYHKGKEQK